MPKLGNSTAQLSKKENTQDVSSLLRVEWQMGREVDMIVELQKYGP